jgi:hypothetical protein
MSPKIIKRAVGARKDACLMAPKIAGLSGFSKQLPRQFVGGVKLHDIGCHALQIIMGATIEKAAERQARVLQPVVQQGHFCSIQNGIGRQGGAGHPGPDRVVRTTQAKARREPTS